MLDPVALAQLLELLVVVRHQGGEPRARSVAERGENGDLSDVPETYHRVADLFLLVHDLSSFSLRVNGAAPGDPLEARRLPGVARARLRARGAPLPRRRGGLG